MFELLGGRLTGSLAVSFIPSRSQTAPTKTDQAWVPQAAPLLAHAGVYADNRTHWIPGSSDFVELTLTPRVPAPASPGSHTTQQPRETT